MYTTTIERYITSLEQPKYSFKICGIFKTPARITIDSDESSGEFGEVRSRPFAY